MKLNLAILLLLILFVYGCTSNIIDDIPLGGDIINSHEHIQSIKEAEKFIEAMDKAGISKTFLVGSPRSTVYGGEGFSDYDKNNQEILTIKAKYPDKFEVLCTIDPRDGQKLEKLKDCIKNGSKGLKLYNGHYALFYDELGPLNRTEMDEVYDYSEKNNIPILFHVNVGKENLLEEFEAILKKYPNLVINCPHFCLSSIKLSRLKYLFDTYPNVYTDVSFGFFVQAGLERISENTTKYAQLIEQYKDRLMFGTDMVVTSNKRKTVDWIYNLTICYRDMLEKKKYKCNVGNEINGEFNGLNLDKKTLKIIYDDVPKRFLNLD